MTRDEIIRMAREAGFTPGRDEWLFTEMLERFFHVAYAAGAAVEQATVDIAQEATALMHECAELRAECDALRAVLQFIADHDLRGTDLTVAGHIAHALIGKARAALKEAK